MIDNPGASNDVMLARIDERTSNMQAGFADMKAKVEKSLDEISTKYVTKVEFDPVQKNHVTKVEFDPVKRIVYGVVAVILLAVATAVVALVIVK